MKSNLLGLLALIFVVWTSVSVALPAQDEPVATAVSVNDWQATAESSEGASAPGDLISRSPYVDFPPSGLTSRARHLLAFESPPKNLLSYPGLSQAPPFLL